MAEAMQERIKELSEGRMEIDVYGDGQLGGDREVAETVQYGNIEYVYCIHNPGCSILSGPECI